MTTLLGCMAVENIASGSPDDEPQLIGVKENDVITLTSIIDGEEDGVQRSSTNRMKPNTFGALGSNEDELSTGDAPVNTEGEDASQSTIEVALKNYNSTNYDSSIWNHEPNYDETRKFFGKSFAGNEEVNGEPMCDWMVKD